MARTQQGVRWQLKLLALCLPFASLVAVDLGLRALGWTAPDDPLLFDLRSFAPDFSPFVDVGDGAISIRPDWISDGQGLRTTSGTRAGRYFLYPGFRPATFSREKPDAAVRVFTLGGSTTFGLYVGGDAAFSSVLERRLAERAGSRRVEVINLGCPGWESERVANLIPTLLELDPDLLVVYSGHNEMLRGEDRGDTGLRWAARLRARLLSFSTLFGWVNHAVASRMRSTEFEMVEEEIAAVRAGRILTFDPLALEGEERRRLPSPAFRSESALRYARNLRRMIDAAGEADVPLLFVLPVANLLFPPAISGHAEGFERVEEFRSLMKAARQARQAGRIDEELGHLERATALSPDHAMAHFRRGTALLSRGRRGEALVELTRARDLDVRTHRITSELEEAFVATVEAAGGTWIDLRPDFVSNLSPESVERLFVDHLHPTRAGHGRIAELLTPPAAQAVHLPPDPDSA